MCPNLKKEKGKKGIKKKGKEDKGRKKESQMKKRPHFCRQTGRRKARRRREVRSEKLKLLSKIYGNRTVGFHRSKRQSRSTHQELRVGTKIFEFC